MNPRQPRANTMVHDGSAHQMALLSADSSPAPGSRKETL